MSRLRQLAGYAFPSFRSRVLWKFISGLIDDFVRQEVLRQKWMTAGVPRSYDEVLNYAEEVASILKSVKAAQTKMMEVQSSEVLAAQKVSEQSQRTYGFGEDRRNFGQKRRLECWYCHKMHEGGYRNCWRRARESPQWEPRNFGRGFSSKESNQSSLRPKGAFVVMGDNQKVC